MSTDVQLAHIRKLEFLVATVHAAHREVEGALGALDRALRYLFNLRDELGELHRLVSCHREQLAEASLQLDAHLCRLHAQLQERYEVL